MTTVRCYLPLRPDQLEQLRSARQLGGPLPATAVTDQVRELIPDGDEEEREFIAAQVAAASLVASGSPVLVAAADVQADVVLPDEGAWVQVASVDLPRVAAVHVGDDVVTGDSAALPGLDEEIELSWFDTTELDHVIELTQALLAP